MTATTLAAPSNSIAYFDTTIKVLTMFITKRQSKRRRTQLSRLRRRTRILKYEIISFRSKHALPSHTSRRVTSLSATTLERSSMCRHRSITSVETGQGVVLIDTDTVKEHLRRSSYRSIQLKGKEYYVYYFRIVLLLISHGYLVTI